MRLRLALAVVGLALGVVPALTACDPGAAMTITLAEANAKLDGYVDKAVAQLPAGVELKERLRIEEEPCDDVAGADGQQHASRNYEVTGIEAEQIPAAFATLRKWWLDNGFGVLDDEPRGEFLWVEKKDDGFRMTIKAADGDRLILIASSPCVWRDGSPE